MYLIPLGGMLVFVIKVFIILPENRVSNWMFDKVRKLSRKVLNTESTMGSVVKEISIFVSALLLVTARSLIKLTGTQSV